MRILLLLAFVVSIPMSAAVVAEPTVTSLNGVELAATVVYEADGEQRPGLLMVPNWLGLTPAAVEQATLIASFGYVVYVADVYGADLAPKDMDGAKVAAGTLRGDRALMRARMQQHLSHFSSLAGAVPLDVNKLAGIGFCFGGGCVLELARSGAAIPAVISFHGNLDTPNPADASAITASILVCHGAKDPVVPPEQVVAFQAEMEAAQVDYQFVAYGGAVHSFTDPKANTPGRSLYDARTTERAYALMRSFLAERFAKP